MIVTPELDIKDGDFIRIFTGKKTYEIISQIDDHYQLVNDLGVTMYVRSNLFVICPDNISLDPRTAFESAYERVKQRGTDYHKIYKESMGIHVLTWPQEDYLRHRDEKTASDGLPEGHSVDSKQKKGV